MLSKKIISSILLFTLLVNSNTIVAKESRIPLDSTSSYSFVLTKESILDKLPKDNINNSFMADIDKDNVEELIVTSTTTDTSNSLSYYIYKIKDNNYSLFFSKEDIYKGKITINNSTIIQNEPIYNTDDCNAEPSSIFETTYELKNGTIVPINTATRLNTQNNNTTLNKPFAATDGTYIKNPSKQEIEKMLESVALELGIPSVILKAVAWQESKGTDRDNGNVVNWRQFANGQPLIGYDQIGIGIMQVSDYNSNDPSQQEYIQRLKYDIEFNIREGARILLTKWDRCFSTSYDKIPKIGNMEPFYLEHWYYAIWAYNGYSARNNPADYYSTAYQTLVINHVNSVFITKMIDLYKYNPALFTSGILPKADVAALADKNYHTFRIKDIGTTYKLTFKNKIAVRDNNLNIIPGTYINENSILEVDSAPKLFNGYTYYHVKFGNIQGYIRGSWLKPVGDYNFDNIVDIFDMVKVSRSLAKSDTDALRKYDVNNDGIINIVDLSITARNYNKKLYSKELR